MIIKKKNDYLEHHGIKGMKWGIRRFQNKDGSLTNTGKKRYYDARNHKYSKSNRESDRYLWGEKGVKRINRRMNKGQSYTKAWSIELGQQTAKSILMTSIGADLLTGGQLHKAIGKKVVDSYLKSKAAKSVIKIAQNHRFDPIDVTYKIIN